MTYFYKIAYGLVFLLSIKLIWDSSNALFFAASA